MDKISHRINDYQNQIAQKEQELASLNQKAMHKQAAATASNINMLYSREGSQHGQSTGFS